MTPHPPTKLMFFCLGNICRSPLAQGLFAHHARARGVSERFIIASSGTSAAHVGELPDPGSRRVAQRYGVSLEGQRAQQLKASHVQGWDVLVAMDRANLRAARALAPETSARLVLMRDLERDPDLRGRDVPDPWGRGDEAFEAVYTILERTTARLLDQLLLPCSVDLTEMRSS